MTPLHCKHLSLFQPPLLKDERKPWDEKKLRKHGLSEKKLGQHGLSEKKLGKHRLSEKNLGKHH